MLSNRHEFLVVLFEHAPRLALVLLGEAAAGVPPSPVRVVSAEFAHVDAPRYRTPSQVRADRALVFGAPPAALGAIVEVQQQHKKEKLRSWPFYVGHLWFREEVSRVALLVLCPDRPDAAKYRQPIDMGFGNVTTPVVVGPAELPVVLDPRQARDLPQLSVLSALFHHDHPRGEELFVAFAAALEEAGPDRGRQYYDIVLAELPESRQRHLQEVVMTTLSIEYRSAYNRALFEEGKAEGKAEGEAEALLTVLAARGIAVPDDVRARVSACTDHAQLGTWLRRAATITTIDDLLTGPAGS